MMQYLHAPAPEIKPPQRLTMAALDRERSGLHELYRASSDEVAKGRALRRLLTLNAERRSRHAGGAHHG